MLTDEFPEKSWTKRGVNSLFKSCGTRAQLTDGQANGRPRSTQTEENAKLLLQKFPQSATDFVVPIVGWSDRGHLFARKENSQWFTAGTSEAEA